MERQFAINNNQQEKKTMAKQLEINKDYAGIFGLNPEKGQHMTYLGGIRWEMREGERMQQVESQGTTDKATAYINQPSISMGKC